MPLLITSVHPKAEADVAPAISSAVSNAYMTYPFAAEMRSGELIPSFGVGGVSFFVVSF